jgi:hypothetical protein
LGLDFGLTSLVHEVHDRDEEGPGQASVHNARWKMEIILSLFEARSSKRSQAMQRRRSNTRLAFQPYGCHPLSLASPPCLDTCSPPISSLLFCPLNPRQSSFSVPLIPLPLLFGRSLPRSAPTPCVLLLLSGSPNISSPLSVLPRPSTLCRLPSPNSPVRMRTFPPRFKSCTSALRLVDRGDASRGPGMLRWRSFVRRRLSPGPSADDDVPGVDGSSS